MPPEPSKKHQEGLGNGCYWRPVGNATEWWLFLGEMHCAKTHKNDNHTTVSMNPLIRQVSPNRNRVEAFLKGE